MVQPSALSPPRPVPASAAAEPARPDRVLLFLLLLLNLGSAVTTVLGARQVLPSPVGEVLGLTVQGMLFLLLAGAAARHAPLRRWLVVAVFGAFSVYTSFFAYYRTLAGHAVEAEGLDRAHQAHAAFVAAVQQPAVEQLARLETEAASLRALAQDEAAAGATTGAVGYGPVARGYDARARELETQATLLTRELERLAPSFAEPADDADAAAIYTADLAAWQAAPTGWKAAVPTPSRGAYVDLEQQVDLLTPFYKVRRGELPAVVALLLACLVDGIAILLGTTITGRRGRPVVQTVSAGAARVVQQAKDGAAQVQAAWHRPGLPLAEEPAPPPAAPVLRVRLRGRLSELLGALYAGIDPETGAADIPALLAHEEPSFRVAARLLVDHLRAPERGWLVSRDGRWAVPPSRYGALSAWLADALARAVEEEGAPDEERVYALALPG
ncbi:MAG: hypothetical protein H6742_19405 [Alphaproteobacteria bacterium]|nr:hypothetical protein [Alphaproteobacteria bacterium]